VFRFLLRLPDGDPADPPAFITAVPNWDPGDVVWTGSGPGYRVIGTDPLDERAAEQGLNGLISRRAGLTVESESEIAAQPAWLSRSL
jgi:hypothetical protein